MTLAEFLLARIAEDEARVVAECEAKRRILKLHHPPGFVFDADGMEWNDYDICHEDHEDMPCELVRILALPYADHPDYEEGWRP